jgi:PPM family protein phosphatase
MQFRWSGLTHVGKVREINEDTFALEPARGVFAVFDGMGGNVSGEVAAQVASESLRAYLAASDPRRYGGVVGLLSRLNDAVLKRAGEELWLRGMGATAAALWLREDGMAEVGHVGDCRVYRWRAGELDVLTEDHSLLNQMASFQHMPREMVETFQYRNVVTRALGIKEVLSAQVRLDRWQVGDVYLICSDGVHDPGGEELFSKVLWRHGGDVARVCEEVMAGVLAGAARDNATVVAVAVEQDRALHP